MSARDVRVPAAARPEVDRPRRSEALRWWGLLPTLLVIAGCTELLTDSVDFGVVEVRAVRLNGDPVPGADIELEIWPPREVAVGRTGRDGRLLFEFVAPDRSYAILGRPPLGYKRPEEMYGGASTAWVTGIQVEPGGRYTAEFRYMKVGPGDIVVSVTDPDGAPIPGVRLAAFNPRGLVLYRVAGEDGMAAFEGIPFGHWGVQAIPPQEYADFDDSFVMYGDGLVIEEGVERRVDFTMDLSTLPRCDGTIRVTVTDENARPVPGYPVRLFDSRREVAHGSTDSSGRKTFGDLLCGEYGVSLLPYSGFFVERARGTSFMDGLRATAATEVIEVVLRTERCAGSLSVLVRRAGSAPIGGVEVILFAGGRDLDTAVTGADGITTFPVVTCRTEHGVKVLLPPGPVPHGPLVRDGLVVRDGEHAWTALELDGEDADVIAR